MKIKPTPELWKQLGIAGCFSWDNEAQILADVINIVQPKNILETGFFGGSSAFMWLYLSDANLTSVDPMENLYDKDVKHTGFLENVDKLKKTFPRRFKFLKKDSRAIREDIKDEKFDLMFIDGDHLESGIINDFDLAIENNIPWVLVDDFVTSVAKVYLEKYQDVFMPPVRIYNRNDTFEGKPIPIVLLKLKDHRIMSRLTL